MESTKDKGFNAGLRGRGGMAGLLAACVLGMSCATTAPVADGPPSNSEAAYYEPAAALVAEDRTYSPTIRSVQLFKSGFELAPPIIDLNGTETLLLRFDDLAPTVENLSYTLVHCDAAWHPTDLQPIQYLAGATNAYLPAGRTSYNTLQPFIHYELALPNETMRPARSGNYLLKVYRGSDQQDLVLTRRFLVHEQRATIDARVIAPRQVDLRDIAQQVEFIVNTNSLAVQDPFGDLHVTVLQNMRWDDARTTLKPRFVRGTELVYDMLDDALFMAGNEYRAFDLKNLRYASTRVARIVPGIGERVYEAWLAPEPPRAIKRYNAQQDLNGRFIIRNDLVDGDPLGADYVNVRFTLPMAGPTNKDIYVYGQLSDFQCRKEFRMGWSVSDSAYTATILLKQGYYDFSYVTLGPGAAAPDITAIEGSHYQTGNEYLVLVYFSDRMQRCDRLVGMRWVSSR
jgi:hypothetical protein